mgnify:CR=1 FL=1
MLKKTIDLFNSTEELRKLIIENPDLPLVVFAGEDANTGDYSSTSCSDVLAYIGEILNCENDVCDCICDDRIEFEEKLIDKLDKEHPELNDDEFDELLKMRKDEFDPYWEKCIILYVNN